MFDFLLATLIAAAGEPAYLASCPASETRVLTTSTPVAPDSIKPTNRRARFFVDVGSEGEVRHAGMVESSGDAVFDAAALDALNRFKFAPQTQGCISTSSIVPEDFNVPLLNLVRPSPGTTGLPVIPSAPPASAVTICTTAFVRLTGLDVPDARQAPGTAGIDVSLDAAAHVTGAKIGKTSGNAKTDATAVALAKDAQFAFMLPPGCSAKATIYRLELTFH